MHFVSVIHLLGLLLIFIAATMLLPIPFSLYYDDGSSTAFLISAAVTALCGGIAYWRTNYDKEVRAKEGFAVVTFGWIAASLFGSLPFILSGSIPSFTDAFFETMSGFSTTGGTILAEIETLPHGILFWRSLTHWLGGMGIIVLSLAILPFLGVGGMQLFKAEVPGPVADKLTPRVAETAKLLWGVYLLLSIIETILLMFGGMTFFDALCHTFGTLATGGYSTRNASIGAYQSAYIDWVIIFFMLLAGTNFALHYRALRGDPLVYFRDREFRIYLGIICVATILIGLNTVPLYGDFPKAFRDTVFQVISISTTTGYGTADYELWSYSSQTILFMLMFVGGSAGSTSGGMKVMRLHLVVKFIFTEISHLIHPHAVLPVRQGNNVVPREVVGNVVGFFVLFILIFAVGVLLMSFLGLDMPTAFGAVAATLGNIGPGLGLVGPTDNYSEIPSIGKWLLSFFMLLGRLEVFTVVVLFSPVYWRK